MLNRTSMRRRYLRTFSLLFPLIQAWTWISFRRGALLYVSKKVLALYFFPSGCTWQGIPWRGKSPKKKKKGLTYMSGPKIIQDVIFIGPGNEEAAEPPHSMEPG